MVFLIDDFREAVALLSPLGNYLVGQIALDLRRRLLRRVSRNRWHVASYTSFVEWVAGAGGPDTTWMLLDPLFPDRVLPGDTIRLELHRAWSTYNGGQLEYEMTGVCPEPTSMTSVVLVDDAAYTGGTLLQAVRRLRGHGIRSTSAMVCASRDCVTRLLDGDESGFIVRCQHDAPPGSDILHFRDYFPLLPLSGRRIANGFAARHDMLETRLAPALFERGRWLGLDDDDGSRDDIRRALRTALECWAAHLGRPPRVMDVSQLGPNVAVPVARSDCQVRDTDALSTLLGV